MISEGKLVGFIDFGDRRCTTSELATHICGNFVALFLFYVFSNKFSNAVHFLFSILHSIILDNFQTKLVHIYGLYL